MALGKQKLCVSKKYTYIGLFIVAGFLLIFLNYQFLKTKPSTNSRAAKPKSIKTSSKLQAAVTPAPFVLTSDPKKILAQWIEREKAAEKRMIAGTGKPDLTDNSSIKSISGMDSYLNGATFLGEIDYENIYSGGDNYCLLSDAAFSNSPLAMIFREAKMSLPRLNYLQGMSRFMKLSFYQKSNGEIDAYLSNSAQDTGQITRIIHIPYKAFLSSFSYIIKNIGYPLTNDPKLEGDCQMFGDLRNQYNLWKMWALDLSMNPLIKYIYTQDGNIPQLEVSKPINLNKTKSLKMSEAQQNRVKLDDKIKKFNEAFQQFSERYLLPELQVGPFIWTDLLGRIHVTYYLDDQIDLTTKRPDESGKKESNYDYFKRIMEIFGLYYGTEYISGKYSYLLNNMDVGKCNIVFTEKTCELSQSKAKVKASDSLTFINWHMNQCAGNLLGETYMLASANCPQMPEKSQKLIQLSYKLSDSTVKLGLFTLHLLPLDKKKVKAAKKDDLPMNIIISVGAVTSIP